MNLRLADRLPPDRVRWEVARILHVLARATMRHHSFKGLATGLHEFARKPSPTCLDTECELVSNDREPPVVLCLVSL